MTEPSYEIKSRYERRCEEKRSSYEKVYERIFASRQCRALLASIADKLDAVHISDVYFTLNRPDEIGQPATATPQFKVVLPTGTVHTSNGSIWIDPGPGGKAARELVEMLFKQPNGVPTYFCNKDVVLGDKARKGTDSFPEWLHAKTRSMFEEQMEAVRVRIAEEYQDWSGSEYVERKRREFMVASAIEDIKRALGAYDHLGKAVLKEAIDEYLVHSIVES
jgi:hypothetical protein